MSGLHKFKLLKPNEKLSELVSFIEEELPSFKDSEEFVEILEKRKNENQHSLAFCVYMTNKCNSKFYFSRENAQKGSSTIDMGVYFGSSLIYTIEAKLLPTPFGSKSKPRDYHEYIYGKGAGIQRFKEGKHGLDNSDRFLAKNGLIAFVKENDFDFWLKKSNQWILDARWPRSEQLRKIYFKSIARLNSTHLRDDKSKFVLHHYWVRVY